MARGKKKEAALSPAERLQAALVPESEQPYKVPENWCWTYLSYVSNVVTGGTPSKKHPEYYGGTFPFFKPSDLDFGRQVLEASEYLTDEGRRVSRVIPKYSTAVCCIGSIGKCGFLEVEGTTNQQINSAIPKFNPLFLYYYCNTHYFCEELWSKAAATTISIVNKSKMEDCKFPLAPLPEQQRIVDRIENLFAKLDEAKQKAQDALDSFETRKAAILHKAFTGELAAQWRKEHDLGMNSWKVKPLGDFLELITYGFTNPMPDSDDGPWKITAKSIHDGFIDYSISRKTTKEAFDNLLTDKSRPLLNDVLLTKDGSIGRVAVVDRAGICINQSVALLRPTAEVIPEFLRDLLQSPEKQKIMEIQSGGTALKHIYITRVDKMEVMIPSIQEQREICNCIKNLIQKEQQAKEAAKKALEQIDLTKKAILARAFRGELGTNDPSEESAVELLKKLMKE